ncbi:MAG: hypothetical protein ACREXN_02740 [Polaromonas sp.]
MSGNQSSKPAAQLAVTPTEVLGLRALIRELEAKAVDREIKIADLKKENASLKNTIQSLHSSRPAFKVVSKRPRGA